MPGPTVLDQIVLADLASAFPRHRRRDYWIALTVHDFLPSQQLRLFDRHHPHMCRCAQERGQPDPQPEMTALACLIAIAGALPYDAEFPHDAAGAFDAMNLRGDLVYLTLAKSGFARVAALCQRFPDEYAGPIQNGKQNRLGGSGADLSGPVGPKLLRNLLARGEWADPQFPRTRAAYERMPTHEIEALMRMAAFERESRLEWERFVLDYCLRMATNWSSAVDDSLFRSLLAHKMRPTATAVRRMSNQLIQEQLKTDYRKLAWRRDDSTLAILRAASGVESNYIDYYALRAGWEFDRVGARRDLCWSGGVTFSIPRRRGDDEGVPELGSTPITLNTPHDESCPCCGIPMVCMLDLDLKSHALRFLLQRPDGSPLGKHAARLRFPMCPECIHDCDSMLIYSRVTLEGGATVADPMLKKPPTRVPIREADPLPSPTAVRLGPPVDPDDTFASSDSIGGVPHWEQDPEWPKCCCCDRLMLFIGQARLTPRHYAFLCADCMVTTVTEQPD